MGSPPGSGMPDNILIALGEIKGKVDQVLTRLDRFEDKQNDHESRLAILEGIALSRKDIPDDLAALEQRVNEVETWRRSLLASWSAIAAIVSAVALAVWEIAKAKLFGS